LFLPYLRTSVSKVRAHFTIVRTNVLANFTAFNIRCFCRTYVLAFLVQRFWREEGNL